MAKIKLKKPKTKSQKLLFVVVAVVVVLVLFFYLSSGSSDDSGDGNSSVSAVPNIQNVPGGKTDPEYYRALVQMNKEAARQAQLKGESSVSTLINTSGPGFNKGDSCSHKCCTCETPKVKDTIAKWLAGGKISQATANQLSALGKKNLSVGDYAKALDQLVREGKLTPEQARELLEQYKKEHGDAVAAKGAKTIDSLIRSGKLPLDAANELMDLQKNGASVDDYAKHLAQLVREGKISPAEARRLLAEYKKQHGGGEGVTLDKYLHPAKPKLHDYNNVATNLGNANFGSPKAVNPVDRDQAIASGQFQDSQVASPVMSAEQQALLAARQQQITALSASMKTQATNVVKGGQTPVQVALTAAAPKHGVAPTANTGDSNNASASSSNSKDQNKAPIVKAGDIEFAVLDTAVNSDYPDSPVMATIVQGKLKGGKLLGKLSRGNNNSNDRVILTFNLLNMPKWSKPVSITAVAINPQTARSAIATSVNHHYLSRYAALFASAFLEGYGDTFTQAGQVVIGNDNGKPITINSQTLSPKERAFAGLGKVGQETGSAAEQYFNTPPTVRVKSGVSLGILFMQNVSTDGATTKNNNKAKKQ